MDNAQANSYHSYRRAKLIPDAAEAAKELSIKADMISNILPVTEFQRYAVRCAFQKPRTEWNYFFMSFNGPSAVPRLRDACQQLVSSLEILRCVFLPHGCDGEYVQVILRNVEAEVNVLHLEYDESLD